MELRNIAIIAHVDHGKTTLVDALLRETGAVRANQAMQERALDSGDIERERGITILAKCTSVNWGAVRINIVDTPGHADFGGEVERVLGMVDGVLLLVDAAEGPMPQTKFVVEKALRRGLRPIVVINKIDRPDSRPDFVHAAIFDLFAGLDATEEQLDFPVLFASARSGWASASAESLGGDMKILLDTVVSHVPAPEADPDAPFALVATILEADPFLGRVLTGRIAAGVVRPNTTVKALNPDGKFVEEARISKLLAFSGLGRSPVEEARAGDIVAVAGLKMASVADTIADLSVSEPLSAQPVDPPTLAVTFSINNSPLAGQEGQHVTSRVLRARLLREAESNVAIRVSETDEKDALEVSGRGELQLGVLIETMRREGFELSVSRPRVLFRTDPDTGATLEPVELVQIDVDDEYVGTVVEALGERRGELVDMHPSGGGKTRIAFHAPSRGLIGYHGEFLSTTRGTGVMNRVLHGYEPHKGPVPGRRNGTMIANGSGNAVAYALWNLEERGPLFIKPGERVYSGMVIGEHARGTDLDVNPLKGKQLTNIRASGKDDAIRLTTPRIMSLEASMAYIAEDELVEVTPRSIRLRKRELDPHARKRAARSARDREEVQPSAAS